MLGRLVAGETETSSKIQFARVQDDLASLIEPMSGTARPSRKGWTMAWIFLISAGLLEVVWAYFMKRSEGFTILWPTVVTLVVMAASFALLSISMKTLPLGTAYTIWTGIGAVGAFLVGIVILGESVTPMRLIAGALILAGLLMMKLSSPH